MEKKYYVLLYCDKSVDTINNTHNFLIKNLKNKFKNFYLLNFYYLNNPKIKKESNAKKTKKFIFEPKNYSELKKKFNNKNVVAILINNFGTNLPKIRTLLKLKKLNIKLVQIKDIPEINHKDKILISHFFLSFFTYTHKLIYEILEKLMKVEIHALSMQTLTEGEYKAKIK